MPDSRSHENSLLTFDSLIKCRVIKRINRFVISVEYGNREYLAHTNNTGRMLEFMDNGHIAYCVPKKGGKTDFSLIAFADNKHPELAALVDTRLQMRSFESAWKKNLIPWLRGWYFDSRDTNLYGSKIDYLGLPSGEQQCIINPGKFELTGYFIANECNIAPKSLDDKLFIELKSAAERGMAGNINVGMYPDCPSTRGQKHMKHLTQNSIDGGNSMVVFVCALPHSDAFTPNPEKDPDMLPLMLEANMNKVCFKAINIHLDPNNYSIVLESPDIPVIFPIQAQD